MKQVILYHFPTSEPCHKCANAVGLTDNQWASDKVENIEMAAICLANCHSNDGVTCKKQILRKEESDE